MAEGGEVARLVLDADEPALAAPRDVLEEHPLDGALGAVREDLLGRWLHHAGPHRADTLSPPPQALPRGARVA